MPSFEEAFPDIEEISIKAEEMFYEKETYYLRNDPVSLRLGEHIPYCSNRLCHDGGFSLGPVLRKMYRNKETEHEELLRCTGHEHFGSRWKVRPCINRFTIKVAIKYRDRMD